MSKSENRLKLNEVMPELAGEVSSFFENIEQTKKIEETIFVMVPSYRDKDLDNTLTDLYQKATNPELLTVCVFDQSEHDGYVNFDKTNMHYIHTNHRNAKGISHARNIIQNFYNNETYFLSIDSHMRFTSDWDTTLKRMYKQLKEQGLNPILTNYACELVYGHELDLYPEEVKNAYTQLEEPRAGGFGGSWIKSEPGYVDVEKYTDYDGKRSRKPLGKTENEFMFSPWCSLHFMFTEGMFNKRIRFDPDHYFSGDEYNMTLRTFTHGYDLLSPYEPVMYHHYRKDSFKNTPANYIVDNKQWADLDQKGIIKNKNLMTGEAALGCPSYGIGSNRSIEDFLKYMKEKTQKSLSVDLD